LEVLEQFIPVFSEALLVQNLKNSLFGNILDVSVTLDEYSIAFIFECFDDYQIILLQNQFPSIHWLRKNLNELLELFLKLLRHDKILLNDIFIIR
jgi:hypothetical protein